jgi:hypothetical protein
MNGVNGAMPPSQPGASGSPTATVNEQSAGGSLASLKSQRPSVPPRSSSRGSADTAIWSREEETSSPKIIPGQFNNSEVVDGTGDPVGKEGDDYLGKQPFPPASGKRSITVIRSASTKTAGSTNSENNSADAKQ